MCFSENFYLLRKNLSTGLFVVFEITSNKNYFKKTLLQTLCNLIAGRVTKEEELLFYKKYLHKDCVNKWCQVDLGNTSSLPNAKLCN